MDIECPNITLTCLIYRDPFLYNFLIINPFLIKIHKSLMYNSYTLFTCQNILKLDYSIIFYKMLLKATTWPSSYSRPQRSAVFSCPERGVPRRGEQSPIVIISYKGYSPPKCSCSHQTHTHSSKNMHIPTRMSTCHG